MEEPIQSETRNQLRQASDRRKVLLADQNAKDLQYYSYILGRLGYDVHTFASYGEASVRLRREAFDLVIVGQGSANFEGKCVLASAIEKDCHVPVVVLARSIEMPCYLEAMQLGALDYLEKPLLPSEIAKLMRKCQWVRRASV
jgi:DNA-binding NtrC family response regulator